MAAVSASSTASALFLNRRARHRSRRIPCGAGVLRCAVAAADRKRAEALGWGAAARLSAGATIALS